jgi:hypothetical protein
MQRLPVRARRGGGAMLRGHDGPLTSATWSHDAGLVLTASADRHAGWGACLVACLLGRYGGFHKRPGLDGNGSGLQCGPIATPYSCPSLSFTSIPSPPGHPRTARLWHAAEARLLLTFSHERRSSAAVTDSAVRSRGGADAPNPAFASEVQAALFAYLDQLVLLAVGASLHCYRCGCLAVWFMIASLCGLRGDCRCAQPAQEAAG